MRVTERFVALSAAVIISACTSAIAAPRQAAREPLTAAHFERQVSSLVVHDQNGRPYELPFLGGLDVPRPQFVDIDGDGDLDFLMGVLGGTANPVRTSANNFFHWERVAADRFTLRSKRFLNGIDVGSESAPALVDLNGDGLLDLVLGNKIDPATSDFGRLTVFTNRGTRTAPRFVFTDSLKLGDYYNIVPTFGDLDADGDSDLLLGTWNNDVVGFRNVGTTLAPRFARDSALDVKLERVSNSTPALGDLDADGDLDPRHAS